MVNVKYGPSMFLPVQQNRTHIALSHCHDQSGYLAPAARVYADILISRGLSGTHSWDSYCPALNHLQHLFLSHS